MLWHRPAMPFSFSLSGRLCGCCPEVPTGVSTLPEARVLEGWSWFLLLVQLPHALWEPLSTPLALSCVPRVLCPGTAPEHL